MEKVVLVSESESFVGRSLINILLKKGCQVIAVATGDETPADETERLITLSWNPASWFSTKAIVRESLRLFNHIDAVWIIHSSDKITKPFAEIDSSDIEKTLEQKIKGSIALSRELLAALESTDSFLGMVVPHETGARSGIMNGLSQGAFTGFATALMKEGDLKTWSCGMHSNSPDALEFSTAMVCLWEERPPRLRGRWYRHRSKPYLLKNSAFSNTIQC